MSLFHAPFLLCSITAILPPSTLSRLSIFDDDGLSSQLVDKLYGEIFLEVMAVSTTVGVSFSEELAALGDLEDVVIAPCRVPPWHCSCDDLMVFCRPAPPRPRRARGMGLLMGVGSCFLRD